MSIKLCCEDLLLRIAEAYDTTPIEILTLLDRSKCCWIYETSTAKYKKGDRCRIPVSNERDVFCHKHKNRASSNTSCHYVSAYAQQENNIFIPHVGLIRSSHANGMTKYLLLQGDKEKFEKYIAERSV